MPLLKRTIDLREIQDISVVILSITGLLLNFLLLYFILKRTGPKLKSYQKILLQNCIVDIIYNIANGTIRTQCDFKDGNLFLIMTSAYGYIPSPYSNLLILFWAFALFNCVTILPVQFVYRYFIVVKGRQISGKLYAGLIFVALLSAFLYSFMAFFFMYSSEAEYKEKAKLLEADIYYFKEKQLIFIIGDIGNWYEYIQAGYAFALTYSAYGIVIWTSFKVWKHLKMMETNMSAQTREIHQQMTKALIMQAIIPFFVCLLPIGITVVMVVLHLNIDGLGIGISLVLSWIPVVNSLTTILIVKSYRKIIIAVFKCLIRSKSETYVSQNALKTNQTNSTKNNNNKFSQAT